AMGFWGWPLPFPDQIERAARAALDIHKAFVQAKQQPGSPLADFSCGIGIAHGEGIAGKLGTLEQFKVDVFGPPANLASRLESMTKHFGVPILLDGACADWIARNNPSNWARCRRVCRVQPYGMKTPVAVSELLASAVEPGALSEQRRRDYEAALDAFQAGRWADVHALSDRLAGDGPTEVLRKFMAENKDVPPPVWEGVIVMQGK